MALSNEIDLTVEQLPQNSIIVTEVDATDYNTLINKPKINGAILEGDKTSSDLGLASASDLANGLATKQDTLVSGTNIKTVNGNSLLGSGNVDIDALPSQTGQSGKFLTTDGTDASWANVEALPSQTGQSGKFLTTDGTDASWATVDALPSQTGNAGKYLTTDGSTASWEGPMAGMPLFYHTFQDHVLNNASWLRADTFSWQSGAVYVSAYNHLVNDLMTNVETLYCWNRPTKEVYTTKENPSIGDSVYIINNGIVEFASTIDNISGNVIYPSGMQAYTRYSYGDINNQEVPITAETETISGTTITFYRATDGHKIVLADQESNVSAIFNATGVAWYYILDTNNTRFKLPRSKWNFVGLRDTVGNYAAESLPNITGGFGGQRDVGLAPYGAFYKTAGQSSNGANAGASSPIIKFDASLSSSAYQDNAPVQQRATQAYLYFYVGNTVQDQTTIDVGEITDALNGKVDLPTNKTQADVDFVVESYSNGTSWYRVYKSGWCEQGGYASQVNTTISFLKEFVDTNYSVLTTFDANGNPLVSCGYNQKATDSFYLFTRAYGTGDSFNGINWQAKGYIA